MTRQRPHKRNRNGTVFVAGRGRVPIPPAWKNVKRHHGKNYVVTGVDEKGKTQYIYKETFKKQKAKEKYNRVKQLRKDVKKLVQKACKDRGCAEAEVVYAMRRTGFRLGGESEIKPDKPSFGLTTLKPSQVRLSNGRTIHFRFNGKSGVKVDKTIHDKKLHDILKKNLNKGYVFNTTNDRVRAYMERISNGKYKAKDLRTLKADETARGIHSRDKKKVGEAVSKALNNTPRVALQSYVNPELVR